MEARLRVLSGPHSGQTIHIQRGKLVIGREEDCQLRPESEFVSRHHCALLLDEYTLRIRDLGSKNGTFVNGRRLGTAETILKHDDMISIGEMIAQIDFGQPSLLPSTSTAPAEAPQQPELHGTGCFEGDTVQAESPVPSSDPQATESLSTPLMPDALSDGMLRETKPVNPPLP